VNKSMAALLRIALWSLHLTVGYAADLDLRAPDLRSLYETEAVTISGAPLLPEQKADTRPPLGGIASLYWAARHPTQAWRVFLPIQLDGNDTAADITATCTAAIATVPSGGLACS
jgi:hypothetical protein